MRTHASRTPSPPFLLVACFSLIHSFRVSLHPSIPSQSPSVSPSAQQPHSPIHSFCVSLWYFCLWSLVVGMLLGCCWGAAGVLLGCCRGVVPRILDLGFRISDLGQAAGAAGRGRVCARSPMNADLLFTPTQDKTSGAHSLIRRTVIGFRAASPPRPLTSASRAARSRCHARRRHGCSMKRRSFPCHL